jgi:hypothetical protein
MLPARAGEKYSFMRIAGLPPAKMRQPDQQAGIESRQNIQDNQQPDS